MTSLDSRPDQWEVKLPVRKAKRTGGPEAEGGVRANPDPAFRGRLPSPPRFRRWVLRNRWRLWPGVGLACVTFLLVGPEVFPFGMFGEAAGWRRPGDPVGLRWPHAGEWRALGVVVVVCVFEVVVWWRASEVAADRGGGPVGRWLQRQRTRRVLAHVQDRFRYGVVEMGFVAPAPWWAKVPDGWRPGLRKVGVHPREMRPQAVIPELRVDAIGGLVGELHYSELAHVAQFQSAATWARLQTALTFETGHRRRAPFGGSYRARLFFETWPGRLLLMVVHVLVGERRYRLAPNSAQLGHSRRGGRYRTVRFMFPDLAAEHLAADPGPSPDNHRIRLALGESVVYWDLNEHPHADFAGPTGRGKGHILRRIAWQGLQPKEDGSPGFLVVMIDGQAGAEHGLFDGLPNYWWFDPVGYQDRYGTRSLPGWVQAALSDDEWDEVLGEVPSDLWPQVAHLVYVLNQLRSLVAVAWDRVAVSSRNHGERWHHWSPADQAANPRILLLCDELNTLLGKGNGPGKVGERLRKEIGALLGVHLFGSAKFGINVGGAFQILYSASHMARGMYAQFGLVAAVGNIPVQHRIMVSQVKDWPEYEDATGYGVVGPYARGPMEPVRFPPAFPREYAPHVDALREANDARLQAVAGG